MSLIFFVVRSFDDFFSMTGMYGSRYCTVRKLHWNHLCTVIYPLRNCTKPILIHHDLASAHSPSNLQTALLLRSLSQGLAAETASVVVGSVSFFLHSTFQIPHSTAHSTLQTKKAPGPLSLCAAHKDSSPKGGALFLWRLRRIELGRFFIPPPVCAGCGALRPRSCR